MRKSFLLPHDNQLEQRLINLNVDPSGVKILLQKRSSLCIAIKGIKTAAANILKQDALSVGADVATPRQTITCGTPTVDVILLVTPRQLSKIVKKLFAQPFGLRQIAKEIASFINLPSHPKKIMGVLNINDDSFFQGSRVHVKNFLARVESMIGEGADILDIGAVSSRPGSLYPGAEEELARLKPIVEILVQEQIAQKVTLSIDAFEPRVVAFAVDNGFQIINDITGLSHDEVITIAAQNDVQAVMMHMAGDPTTMQDHPSYHDVVAQVDHFFEDRLAKAHAKGLDDIVLDIGLGFGKTLEHNMTLLKSLSHFRHFGLPLLVGASRKSMINAITPTPIEERLPGTLALHLEGWNNGASIVRCHDVAAHRQVLSIMEYRDQNV